MKKLREQGYSQWAETMADLGAVRGTTWDKDL